jgi:aminoglycoside 3-N-acetyltransferase
MTIPITTKTDLAEHVAKLGVRAGDHLTVHARLLSFGRLEGGAATAYDVLRAVVGPTGTIVVPTYTLAATTVYNVRSTPSEGMGALAEYVRVLSDAVRSRCPMHNHAGVGARSDALYAADGLTSFGPGSDFDAFHDAGFRLLLLGVGFNEAATFVHHVEARADVPYRTWLALDRRVADPDGMPRTVVCRYFGRSQTTPARTDFEPLARMAFERRIMTRVPTHFGVSSLVALQDLQAIGLSMLRADPLALVAHA